MLHKNVLRLSNVTANHFAQGRTIKELWQRRLIAYPISIHPSLNRNKTRLLLKGEYINQEDYTSQFPLSADMVNGEVSG